MMSLQQFRDLEYSREQIQERFSRQDAKYAKKTNFFFPNLASFATLRESSSSLD